MNRNLVRVAFIGAGNMAAEHIRAFADLPAVALAGIHSRTRARAESLAARHGIAGVYDSIAAMHATSGADLVVIAVSELSLRAVCAAAFPLPWTCLLEKPAGYDAEDAAAIAAATAARGRAAFVGLNRRHYGSTRSVLAAADADGSLRLIQVLDQQDAASRVADRPAPVVANWMYANSIHLVDYLRLFGRGLVTAVVPTVRWTPAAPRHVAATITFSSGDIGLYTAVWNGPGPWSVSVSTPARRWELRPLERATVQERGSRTVQSLPDDPWDAAFKPGLRRQAEEAVKAVRGEPHGLPSLEQGLESVRLVRAIYEP